MDKKMQKHFWQVIIEGLDWTKKRKIWNGESARATYNLESYFAKSQGRKIELILVNPPREGLYG